MPGPTEDCESRVPPIVDKYLDGTLIVQDWAAGREFNLSLNANGADLERVRSAAIVERAKWLANLQQSIVD